jgi:hypothetical protein
MRWWELPSRVLGNNRYGTKCLFNVLGTPNIHLQHGNKKGAERLPAEGIVTRCTAVPVLYTFQAVSYDVSTISLQRMRFD